MPSFVASFRATFQNGLWTLPLLKLLIHLPWLGQRGMQRDEYYFIACGLKPAWGYVDHAPLVPWIAAAMHALFGPNLVALRILSPLVLSGVAALTMHCVALLGGGTFARLLAGLCVLISPVYLLLGGILHLPVFEQVFWLAGNWILLLIVLGKVSPRWFLVVGVVTGVGLLNKHSMLLWGLATLVGLLWAVSTRPLLRTRWPYLGGIIALAIWGPNLWWQVQNNWATGEFLLGMSSGTLQRIPRSLFLAAQFLYMHPMTIPVWVAGVWHLWTAQDGKLRPFAIQVGVVLGVFLLTSAKPYYLAPAYPLLFAAGAVELSRRGLFRSLRVRRLYAGAMAAGGLAFALLVLPILSLRQVDTALDAVLGSIIPARELMHDAHDQFGWREQALGLQILSQQVRKQYPQSEELAIVTGNYGQAAALQLHRRELQLPAIYSGSMNYHLWKPPVGSFRVLAYGLGPKDRNVLCPNNTQIGLLTHPLASETDLKVWLCDEPVNLRGHWAQLKNYQHRMR